MNILTQSILLLFALHSIQQFLTMALARTRAPIRDRFVRKTYRVKEIENKKKKIE